MSHTPSRQEIGSIASWMIETSLRRGARMADVLFYSGSSSEFSLRDGSPERDIRGSSFRIGCRTVDVQGRQGVADTDNLSKDAIGKLIDVCLQNCRASEPEPDVVLYDGEVPDASGLMIFDPGILEVQHPERQERCRQMYELASGTDSRVVSVRDTSWADGSGSTMYASSEGFLGWYDDTYAACSVTVVMSDGGAFEMTGASAESRRIGDVDHSAVAREAVERGTLILGGEAAATGVYDVVLDPEAAASLVESAGELFLASAVFKNRSMLKNRMGDKIGSDCLTLVDDGTIPWGVGTSPWDGEGVPSGRTVLMDHGVVSSFLYNLKYARKFKVASTGNASRSPGSIPEVGFSNLFVVPGERSPRQILKDCSGGILVTELMGVHTIDPVSGDLSLGVKGALIGPTGQPGKPVAGMTMAGNLINLLSSISEVGNDLRFFGDIGGCTMVVRDVSMAGT
ncbi:MAG TPA: metallopeptidase TldD-related protein [Synergistales bacterium]|jgi:PmbA protein|nr:metallopeptidase TldD-related protein [Synergistales bacterium]MDD4022693.1 metallopeptidase TldD-related protein [Synergistales bacterium]NLV65971.1 TldD/PmbA family protein [Synergistaceae bacterium]HOI82590.1 metallopeptidase TldD-related protein [Synergistales bacterium]HOP52477.1 metallopeptidase TldD-related protein [Synergistales bacterium]